MRWRGRDNTDRQFLLNWHGETLPSQFSRKLCWVGGYYAIVACLFKLPFARFFRPSVIAPVLFVISMSVARLCMTYFPFFQTSFRKGSLNFLFPLMCEFCKKKTDKGTGAEKIVLCLTSFYGTPLLSNYVVLYYSW